MTLGRSLSEDTSALDYTSSATGASKRARSSIAAGSSARPIPIDPRLLDASPYEPVGVSNANWRDHIPEDAGCDSEREGPPSDTGNSIAPSDSVSSHESRSRGRKSKSKKKGKGKERAAEGDEMDQDEDISEASGLFALLFALTECLLIFF